MQIESTTLWDFPRQNYGDKLHGNNKYNGVTPAMVIWNLLQRYTKEDDLVVDPMCGSGTTIDVASELNRKVIGYDLNIVRSEFDINNTLFSDIRADAFDSDFCTGNIFNSSFINCGNDAIDISGTNLKVDNVTMDNIGDKGLSSGEKSKIIASNMEISNSEIAVCSKDLSHITISSINLQNNKIGFTAFQKKSEFGPGIIKGADVVLKDISIPYLIETNSYCSINGKDIESTKDNVKDILYGNEYGKSSK